VQSEVHDITKLCEALDVTRSAYYQWLKKKPSPRKIRQILLLNRIVEIFEESRQTYGCPRIYDQLRAEGWICGKNTVERLMRENEIRPKTKRKFRATTSSKHDLPIALNVLDREFEVEEAHEVWVSDITYIPTAQGWLYLCVFIDLYSRMIVGWSMSSNMRSELVVDAFKMGIDRTGSPPIVVHSDRGSQYASENFRMELDQYDCIQSMSRRGNCWDNAVAESFFASLKKELIFHENFISRIHASTAVFEYIEIFYNKRRRHSTLGYLTPEEKELKGRKVAQSDCA
jgi:Transposase and inactivated derivatives